MRITGGRLRGRRLRAKIGPGVRPTGARVREALFNVLGNELEGTSVLDATGGSGILAFEAASRGAAPVLILDRNRRVVTALVRSLEQLGLGDVVTARVGDSLRVATSDVGFDLVLADPPYAQELQPWVDALLPRALSCLVLEHAAKKQAPAAPRGWSCTSRRYGDSCLSFYRKTEEGSGR